MSTCIKCQRDKPIRADGASLGYVGPLCHACYQGEWQRQRRPGPLQARAARVERLAQTLLTEVQTLRAEIQKPRGLRS